MEALYTEVNEKMREFHPDTRENERVDSDEIFRKLLSARGYLNGIKGGSIEKTLLPYDNRAVEQLANTIAERENRREAAREEERAATALKESAKDKNDQLRRIFRAPQIGSAAISTVVTFAWLFPDTVAKHPVLGEYVNVQSPVFTGLWVAILSITVALIWVLRQISQRDEEFQTYINLESTQNRIFEAFKSYLLEGKGQAYGGGRFSKGLFLNYVNQALSYGRRGNREFNTGEIPVDFRSYVLSGHKLGAMVRRGEFYDEETVQNLSDLILTKAQNKEIIREIESQSLEESYEFTTTRSGPEE